MNSKVFLDSYEMLVLIDLKMAPAKCIETDFSVLAAITSMQSQTKSKLFDLENNVIDNFAQTKVVSPF